MHNFDWVALSDEHLYDSIKCIREHYGNSVRVVFKPAVGVTSLTEDEIIFSRALAKFHHLIILED
jgi:hypothetical protein